MKGVIDTLGGQTAAGLAVLVLACISLFALEVIRQTRVAVAARPLQAARISAGILTAAAVLLITARFLYVGGVL